MRGTSSSKAADRAVSWPIWLTLAVANVIALALRWRDGGWLVNPDRTVRGHDYLAQMSAGRRLLGSDPALVYDWAEHARLNALLLGTKEPIDLYFFYPPHFLFTTPAFAWLPPLPAYVAFLVATITLYAISLRLVDRSVAPWAALAGGGAFMCGMYVQNGFLTAAIFVSAVALLPKRPILSGILFGFLTMKPQLGLLIPFALIAGGHWRTIATAIGTFLALALVTEVILGPGIWTAFVRSMLDTGTFLSGGAHNLWVKIQSPYALAWPFVGKTGAYAIQAAVGVGVVTLVMRLWYHRDLDFRFKAAALIAGSFLMSPYQYAYDAVALSAAALFLPRLPLPDTAILLLALLLPAMYVTLVSGGVAIAALAILLIVIRAAARSRSEFRPHPA